MRCEKFEELWNEYLDQRISPRVNEELTAHAAVCSKCAELMVGGEVLQCAFPGLPQPALSPSFSDRVLAAWNEEAGGLDSKILDLHCLSGGASIEPITVTSDAMAQANDTYGLSTSSIGGGYSVRQKTWLGIAVGIAAAIVVAIVLRDQATVHPQHHLVQPAIPVNTYVKVPPQQGNHTSPVLPLRSKPAVAPVVAEPAYGVATVFNREQISQVGYSVADGITPVTKSVSAALQSLKKPLEKEEATPAKPNKSNDSSFSFAELSNYA